MSRKRSGGFAQAKNRLRIVNGSLLVYDFIFIKFVTLFLNIIF